MAYEEKRTSEEENDIYSLYKLIRVLLQKWWLIVLFTFAFAVGGYILAKVTYKEVYTSSIIFNISNREEKTYLTASDAQASATIASNFKILVTRGNDFIVEVQKAVKAKTGNDYSKGFLRGMIKVDSFEDSTMLGITVEASSKELAYAVSTSIQSVYSNVTNEALPTANIVVSDNATEATLKSDSSALIYTFAGLVAGFIIAVAFIFIISRLKNMLLSSEDIKKRFNISIIASVSKIKSAKKGERTKLLITDRNVGLPFIETFKLVRTKIENVKLKKGYSVFAVTSSTESEGKTTCSSNIALSLAKSGKSVLLIDADLRKPAVYKTLGIPVEGDMGVYDIVSGKKTFEEAVKYVEKFNLYLLISATPVAEPSEVLASRDMEAIIREAKKNFDYVIVDCPPAGVVADAAIIANYTDSIIFVAAEDRVSLSQVEYALSDLMTTKADILGCIYNYANGVNISVKNGKGGYYLAGYGGYGGYYGRYYGSYGNSSHSHKKGKH